MKRKYLIIVILIMAAMLIGIGIISIPSLIEAKYRYEYSLFVENVNKAFEEMVTFCEKNQKEIETYSNRYILSKHSDMSSKEIFELEEQIMEDMDCAWLFETISLVSSEELEKEPEIVLYSYKDFDYIDINGMNTPCTIEIFYIGEETSLQEFENMYFFDTPYILCDIKKISNHLYVCVRGYMCI